MIKSFLKSIEWDNEAVSKPDILRLIYQGRFLHSNVTLVGLGLPFGKTTVMHLIPRETLPEPNSQGSISVILLNNLFNCYLTFAMTSIYFNFCQFYFQQL